MNHTRACENLNIAVLPMCVVRIDFVTIINASVYAFNLIYNYFKTKIEKTTKQLYFSVKFYVQPLSAKQFINKLSGFFSLKTKYSDTPYYQILCTDTFYTSCYKCQFLFCLDFRNLFLPFFKQILHNEHSRMKNTLQKCKILLTNQFIFSFTFFLIS